MLARTAYYLGASQQTQTLRGIVALVARRRELTWALAKRELSERYTGHVLGSIWVVVHPLIMMAVYVFIFAYVLKIRLGESSALPGDYATYLLAGLIPWISFQDSMNKGCRYITANAPLVKQIVFPVELLPIKGVLTSFVNQMIATTVLLLYVYVNQGALRWSFLLLPVLFFFQLLAMVGVNFFLSSVSVYFRDMSSIVQVFGVIGLYLMPVFYLPQWVPGALQPVLYANPFSYLIWCYQDALYYGEFVHWWAWCLLPVLSIGVLFLGHRTFRALRVMFASAL